MEILGGHADRGAHAVDRGHDTEAQFDGWIFQGDAAFLGDVHAIGEKTGHDHQAGDNGAAGGGGEGLFGLEDSVDAQADFAGIGGGLDVNVRSGKCQSAADEGIDDRAGIFECGGVVSHGYGYDGAGCAELQDDLRIIGRLRRKLEQSC